MAKKSSKAGNNNPDSNGQNDKENFPGYPHYPAKDDIMTTKNSERVDADIENFSRSNQISTGNTIITTQGKEIKADSDSGEDLKIVSGTDADVTKDDLISLNERDVDTGGYVGEDLDIPGAEDDDADEEIGEEDEENNYYSLGGDDHENLEEDKG